MRPDSHEDRPAVPEPSGPPHGGGAGAGLQALLRERLPEVLRAVIPLIGVMCVLQFTVVHAPAAEFLRLLAGSLLVASGMLLLLVGVDMGILPMGRFIGAELPRKGSVALIVAVALVLGIATTAAEPDVLILASQVEAVSQGGLSGRLLVYVIAVGVGVFAAVALLRIVHGSSFRVLLGATYLVMIILCVAAPPGFVPLAFDSGSVTTGVVTAPALLAVALGVSSVLVGRSASADGFGLLGLASAGPIVAILLLAWVQR